MRFPCPHSNTWLTAPEGKVGKITDCPKCNRPVQVPAPRMVRFRCALCGTTLERPESFAGEMMACPSCKERIEIPGPAPTLERGPVLGEVVQPPPIPARTPVSQPYRPPAPRPAQEPVPATGESKACPFCGEAVLAIAKKCKHCGETIDLTLRLAEEASRGSGRGQINVSTHATAGVHQHEESAERDPFPQPSFSAPAPVPSRTPWTLADGLGFGALMAGIASCLFCWITVLGCLLGIIAIAVSSPGVYLGIKKEHGEGLGLCITSAVVGIIGAVLGVIVPRALKRL